MEYEGRIDHFMKYAGQIDPFEAMALSDILWLRVIRDKTV